MLLRWNADSFGLYENTGLPSTGLHCLLSFVLTTSVLPLDPQVEVKGILLN